MGRTLGGGKGSENFKLISCSGWGIQKAFEIPLPMIVDGIALT